MTISRGAAFAAVDDGRGEGYTKNFTTGPAANIVNVGHGQRRGGRLVILQQFVEQQQQQEQTTPRRSLNAGARVQPISRHRTYRLVARNATPRCVPFFFRQIKYIVERVHCTFVNFLCVYVVYLNYCTSRNSAIS